MNLHLELRGVLARDSAGRALPTSQIGLSIEAAHGTIAHVEPPSQGAPPRRSSNGALSTPRPRRVAPPKCP